jgi:hypothetical protein
MQAVLELVAARVDRDQVRFMLARRACSGGTDPDDIAQEGMDAQFPTLPRDRVVLHSTSWRYGDGILTLTYLGYSDELPLSELPLMLPPDARPNGDDADSVVAHAIRHLAFLIRQDPEKYGRPLSDETRAYFAGVEPDVAGRIHGKRAA